MARYPTIFKRNANLLLQHIAVNIDIGVALPTEHKMAELGGGSRTAVRSVIAYLLERGLIDSLKERRLCRKPVPDDYFDLAELQSGGERIQQVMMERIYHSDMAPGTEFSEAELARAAGTSTVSVREFLIGFSRLGLIEKKSNGGWRLCAFDRSFAMELADVRQMFELAAIEKFGQLPQDHPAHVQLEELIARHVQLGSVMPRQHKDFPALDRDFHSFLINLLENRFAHSFYDVVSLVFHYHYQWDKGEEMTRNEYAVHEHLVILRALARHDTAGALDAMRTHLQSSRSTLLSAIQTRASKSQPA